MKKLALLIILSLLSCGEKPSAEVVEKEVPVAVPFYEIALCKTASSDFSIRLLKGNTDKPTFMLIQEVENHKWHTGPEYIESGDQIDKEHFKIVYAPPGHGLDTTKERMTLTVDLQSKKGFDVWSEKPDKASQMTCEPIIRP